MREPRQPGRGDRRGVGNGQGQLDIEMESALRPREIQARIRAGASVDDVAKAAGVPVERIEVYAGPVLAEREHIAGQAQRGSVRRRGETSGHRQLRTAVGERLSTRGVDVEAISWDALRMEDGRWSVSASYASGEATRHAIFYFDPRGRFSVAGNDEGRWVLGEQSPVHGPQPGRRPVARAAGEDPDTEPTLDLNDELALVRATQELGEESDGADLGAAEQGGGHADTEATIVRLRRQSAGTAADDSEDDSERDTGPETRPRSEPEDDTEEEVAELDDASELDLLYDMLGGDGYAEDSGRVYPGLDRSAPSENTDGGWEPAMVMNYPVDPENESHSPRSPMSVTESLDETPVDEGELEAADHADRAEGAERAELTEPEQPALDEVEPVEDAGPAEPGTLVDAEPVEVHASDDINQQEGAAARSVRAEPPEPGIGSVGEESSESVIEPAPGSETENDASDEDAVPESDEAPASKPPSADPGPSPVEVSPNPAETEPETEPESDPETDIESDPGQDTQNGSTQHAQPGDGDPSGATPAAAPKKTAPKKRKRAEVPSWDEIMFGGPKRS